jgi:hypothetical protein
MHTERKEAPMETAKIAGLRRKLERWLDKKNSTHEELLGWMQGYELPALGHEEEPYIWLLRALAHSDQPRRDQMTRRVAALLREKKPYELASKSDEPLYDDDFSYNLFRFCSSLPNAAELAGPLDEAEAFLRRQFAEDRARFERGRWYQLRGALREALIFNQRDRSRQKLWRNIVAGRPDDFLLGSRYSGFDALSRMPDSATRPDHPALDQIAWAGARMAEYLDEEPKRHIAFRDLLLRAKRAWPDYPLACWRDLLFGLRIEENAWPDWAFARITWLSDLIAPVDDTLKSFLIWDFYMPYLQGYIKGRPVPYMNGLILHVTFKDAEYKMLEVKNVVVREACKYSPDRSYRNVRIAASEAVMTLGKQLSFMKENWSENKIDQLPSKINAGQLTHTANNSRNPGKTKQHLRRAAAAAAPNAWQYDY